MERVVPRSGASYSFAFECELARVWSGETVDEWDALDGDRQAHIVAAHRAQTQLEAVITHDMQKKHDRPAGPSAPRRRRK